MTDWIPKEVKAVSKQKDRIQKNLYHVILDYRTKLLRNRGITEKNDFHIHEYQGIYYLYEYVPYRKLSRANERKQDLLQCFYAFTRGDKRSSARIRNLYQQYLKKFLWLKNIKSPYLLAVVPSSDPLKVNPLYEVAGSIIRKGNYLNAYTSDGRDLLLRVRMLSPVKKGNHHTVQEHMDSMIVTRKPHVDTVVLLDDIVNSGNTARACAELLKREGVKNVYVLCLFSCRR